jgi:hypothetical protein
MSFQRQELAMKDEGGEAGWVADDVRRQASAHRAHYIQRLRGRGTTDPMANPRVPKADPWWGRALGNFMPQARRYLAARFPAIRHLHDDLVGEVVIDITEILRTEGKDYPGGWFKEEDPVPTDAERFLKLAFTVLQRRIVDHFRSAALRSFEDIEELAERDEPLSLDEPVDRAVDLRRTTAALLEAVEHLSEQDRGLIQRVALGGDDHPLSDRERQRLRRLRLELMDRLRSRLGPTALEILRGR